MSNSYSKAKVIRCLMKQNFPQKVSLNTNLNIVNGFNYFGEEIYGPLRMPDGHDMNGVKAFSWRLGRTDDEIYINDLKLYQDNQAPWISRDSAPYRKDLLKRYVLIIQIFSSEIYGLHMINSSKNLPRKAKEKAVADTCKEYYITQSRNVHFFSLSNKYYLTFINFKELKKRKNISTEDFKKTLFDKEVAYKLTHV